LSSLFTSRILLAGLLCAGSAAAAEIETSTVILSEFKGAGSTIGQLEDVRENWVPVAISGSEIADEFVRICLDEFGDQGAFDAKIAESAWKFQPKVAKFDETKKVGAIEVDYHATSFASASLWAGDPLLLKKRPYASRSRGTVMTGPVNPKYFETPQCNLDLAITGMSDATPFANKMEELLGDTLDKKIVLKKGFADGFWLVERGGKKLRVSFDAVDLKRESQLVHLTVQPVREKKKKRK